MAYLLLLLQNLRSEVQVEWVVVEVGVDREHEVVVQVYCWSVEI